MDAKSSSPTPERPAMKNVALVYGACMLLSNLLPATANAQDTWRFQMTPYLWFAGVEGQASTIPGAPVAPVNVSPRDALRDTKLSLMGVFEAKKGRHGGFADFLYSDVQSDTTLVPSINLLLKTTSKTTLFSTGYEYQLYSDNETVIDLLAGLRYWKIDTELAFGGGLGLLAGRSIREKESWVDPLMGIKGRAALGTSRFYVSGILGLGGFGVGSKHFYDASAHIGYQWSKTIGTTLGYRWYDVKYENGPFLYDVRQEGWLLGMSFFF